MSRVPFLLSVLSGVLLSFSFPSVGLSVLAWLGLVPLLLALAKTDDPRTAFLLGGVAGLAFFGGTVFWVTNSIYFYGGIPLVPASLITLLLCAYLALYPALFGAGLVFIGSRVPRLRFVAAPVLWTALELARTYVFTGFPWSLLGYSQYTALPVIQIADIAGVYGVSFVIVLANAAIAAFINDRKRIIPLVSAFAAISIVLVYGVARLRAPGGADRIRVSVVQGNIEQDRKWDPAYQAEVLATYERITKDALTSKPDLVIWPETATPFYFNGSGPNMVMSLDLISFVRKSGTPLLFGTPTYEVLPGRVVRLRNSAFLIYGNGTVLPPYHKIHLVPFGEYVPLKGLLFFVEKMVQAIGDFQPGWEHSVMTVPVVRGKTVKDVRLSTVICYEIIFPDLVRQFVKNGAQVMTTVTNDAWFGRTAAPYQHFSMAVFRAVENRVPVARAANTGVSGFIDAQGRILGATMIFREAQDTKELVAGGIRTFYTEWGDVFAYLCCLAALAMFIAAQRGRSPRQR
jgi:apolipoprotein N-acyltransferase